MPFLNIHEVFMNSNDMITLNSFLMVLWHIACKHSVVHCNSMLGRINITNAQERQRLVNFRLTLLALLICTNRNISLNILRLALIVGLFFKFWLLSCIFTSPV